MSKNVPAGSIFNGLQNLTVRSYPTLATRMGSSTPTTSNENTDGHIMVAVTDMPVQIGPHQVIREIGRGGMGVVYLARDAKLQRDVAIKALPEEWADQRERLVQFKREARSLAKLNHPNIAGIYGVEEQHGRMFLILEYVEGDTLADRINSGPLPIEEALELAVEIATGIEAAHEARVIHRDLKPSNIKVTPEGKIKVLDFGVAKADDKSSSPTSADAPTLTSPFSPTIPGTILGTPQYMSPEQARGRPVNKQSDIWSFGVIVYEMLTGASPFLGETVSDSIAAVLHKDIDLDRLPSDTTGVIRRVIRRCLERDLNRRLHDIADARIELEEWNSLGHTPATVLVRNDPIVNRSFRINDDVCKALDREGLDPLMLGWDLRYSDNCRDSRILIMWIPSFGADHTSPAYRHLMNACRHRVVTLTPIGMEPDASLRPDLSLENQLVLYRMLARKLRQTLRPAHLVIAGSSCGSIMALRCVAGDETGGLFDGMLAIDPDLEEKDCFITCLFADLDPEAEGDAVRAVKNASSSCETLFEWVTMHEHMLQCIDKMQDDVTPLIRQGQAFAAPYRNVQQAKDSPFVLWLRNACQKTRVVRSVFPDNPEKHRLVGEIRLMHLDHQCLGPCFEDDTIVFASASTHFEMLRTENMLNYIDDIIELL